MAIRAELTRALIWTFARAVLSIAVFAAWMCKEWRDITTVGDATPLFGAFHFVMDTSDLNVQQGTWMCALLIPCILSFPIKPHWLTAGLSLVAGFAWLFLGLIGSGINC